MRNITSLTMNIKLSVNVRNCFWFANSWKKAVNISKKVLESTTTQFQYFPDCVYISKLLTVDKEDSVRWSELNRFQ